MTSCLAAVLMCRPFPPTHLPILPAERILEEATSIWIDVWEEFGTVSGISIRFASWHKSFPAAYQQAFAALCLSRLLTPLLQIQLLRWNPLEVCCPYTNSEHAGTKVFNVLHNFQQMWNMLHFKLWMNVNKYNKPLNVPLYICVGTLVIVP